MLTEGSQISTYTLIHVYTVLSYTSLCSQCSHATRLRSVSLVVLGFVPWSLLQGWRSPSHPLHPLATSELWHPLPWAGGTGWMCASQLYESAVTYEVAHTHILPVFNTGTLMLLLLDFEKNKQCQHIFCWFCKWFECTLQLNFTLAASRLQATRSEVDTHSGCIIR